MRLVRPVKFGKVVFLFIVFFSIVFLIKQNRNRVIQKSELKLSLNTLDGNIDKNIYTQDEETSFPLAFGITVFADGNQLVRLINAIYRPFNLYCIHMDPRGDVSNVEIVIKILTSRHSNIIPSKQFLPVTSESIFDLANELACMNAVLQDRNIKWKYYINLSAQDWPIKTNLEIVRILKVINGANFVEKTSIDRMRIPAALGPAPHEIQPWKGSSHVVVVRDFVKFALHNSKATDFLQYLQFTKIPEETYFSTLNNDHMLCAPGGYNGELHTNPSTHPMISLYSVPRGQDCYGSFVGEFCSYSIRDIPALTYYNNKQLFAHKFVVGMHDEAMEYMEKWFANRTKIVYSDVTKNRFIDLSFYSNLDLVANRN